MTTSDLYKEESASQPYNWPERTVAILNKGKTAIVVDDHCYVVRNWNGKEWGWSAWIFCEALEVLKMLPDNPDKAVTIHNPSND